jgi:hypothetical protein
MTSPSALAENALRHVRPRQCSWAFAYEGLLLGPVIAHVPLKRVVPTEWMWRYPGASMVRPHLTPHLLAHSMGVGDRTYDDHRGGVLLAPIPWYYSGVVSLRVLLLVEDSSGSLESPPEISFCPECYI